MEGSDIAIKPILMNLDQGNPNDFITELELNLVGNKGERVRVVVTPRTYSRRNRRGVGVKVVDLGGKMVIPQN